MQLKDLRTYFNSVVLIGAYGFTNKEAGAYIGNSEAVNKQHYDAVSDAMIEIKMKSKSLSQVLELANQNIGDFERTATKPLPKRIIEGGEIS